LTVFTEREIVPKKKGNRLTTEEILSELMTLLKAFESFSAETELRQRVRALVPVYNKFQLLGPSLLPDELRRSGRNRILHYFLEYPKTVLPGDELAVVGGIGEWARRIRELRVQYGWTIASGEMAKAMAAEEELDLPGIDVATMRVDDYILLTEEQDKEAAYRWNVAKEIRQGKGGAKEKILAYLQRNAGVPVSGEELRYVAKDATEWARRTRELRTEEGWPVVTRMTGRPDFKVGMYMLEQNRQSPPHDRKIPDPLRRKVLNRDKYRCVRCGWSHELYNRSDPRHLEPHHIRKHAKGGENVEENLITLCTVCHDEWHSVEDRLGERGFQAWISKGV